MQLRNKLQLTILSTQLFCYKNKSRHFVALYDAIMKEDPYSPPHNWLIAQKYHIWSDYFIQNVTFCGLIAQKYHIWSDYFIQNVTFCINDC